MILVSIVYSSASFSFQVRHFFNTKEIHTYHISKERFLMVVSYLLPMERSG
jgi:hypothetical protein